jgi:uracil-DNA glycosylase family 4
MGFVDHDQDDIIKNIVPVTTGNGKKRIPKQLNQHERGCDACPLRETWPKLSSPQMKLSGDRESDILVIGEGPGAEEDQRGRPFVGPAGMLLRKFLPMRQNERLAMTNAVRCRPPENRTPTARELHACSIHFDDDVARGDFVAILGLGGVPLSRFLTEASITQVHGLKFPVMINDRVLWYYPTLHPSFVLRTGGDRSPMLPILKNDLSYFFKFVDRWTKPKIEQITTDNIICAYNEDEARGWCNKLKRAGKPIGFDIETNGLRPQTVGAEILTAAVSNGETSVAWPVRHPEMPNAWGLPLLLDMTQNVRWIAHHAGFELAWLHEHARRNDINWTPAKGFDDSMVIARLFQRRETCLSLGALTRIYTGVNIKKLSNINTDKIAETPLTEVLPYNGLDAWGSWRIHQQLGPRVDKTDYQSILETIESVTEMQLIGLDVDRDAANELHEQWTGRAQAAANHARTVYEVKQFERERQVEFNIGSQENVADALISFGGINLPRTTGSEREGITKLRYSTDDESLSRLATDNPLARDTLEYRHATKMVSTYIEPVLQAKQRFIDQRIHPVYSTVLTKTFRTSCEDPNAQNFPKRKDRELRRPVVPPKGCIWGSADYGQLEARVYAMASKDDALRRSIIENEDIHSYWLNVILDAFPPYIDRLATKVTPAQTEAQIIKGGRDIIKSDFVFASFFGTTARNVAERTGIPLDIATDVLGLFWRRYSAAFNWLKRQRREYMETGTTKNLCGVERYGIMTGNEMINSPIQSTAARLVLEAQNELHQLSRQRNDPHLMPRINIHDDLTFALPDDDTQLLSYIAEISQVLVKVRYDFQIVPLKVEWKIGSSWAELYDVHEHTGGYKHG